MSKRYVNVWYVDGELGTAEVLSGRVARIVGSPLLNLGLCRDAIVRLDRSPSAGEVAKVAEVLHSPYPRRTVVRYATREQGLALFVLFSAVGARPGFGQEPGECWPGSLIVDHDDALDPSMLAEAVGVSQAPGPEVGEDGGE